MTHYRNSKSQTILLFIFAIFLLNSCSNDSASHHFKNGSAKYQLQDYSGAITDLNKAIGIKPNYIEAYYTRAICKSKTKKYDQALNDFNKVLELDPTHKDALFNRAYYVKQTTGDYNGAIEDYNHFMELNKERNIAFALNNKGFCRFKMQDTIGGYRDINSSIKLQADNAYAFRYRAEVLIAMDSIEAACKDIKQAIALGYSRVNDKAMDELMTTYCNH
jgi:tetratricopeptide (TPR) repeat protein